MNVIENINKITKHLLDSNWNLSDNQAERLLGSYFDLYRNQKGAISTLYMELYSIKRKLDKLQDTNNHSVYMLEVARFCKDNKYIKIFEHICDLHELDNCLMHTLSEYRQFQYENLKGKYSSKLEPLGIYINENKNNEDLPF